MKKILTFVVGALALASCTDLEDKVYSNILASDYPENPVQAQLLTNPAYSRLRGFADGDWWWAQELTSDLLVCPTRAGDWDDGGQFRRYHTHTWTNNDQAVVNMWNANYNVITECNKAIEFLGSGEASKNAVAQMRVLRAFAYYILIDNFGDVPYLTSFANAPKQPTKAKRADIYNNIITEVVASIPDLNGNSKSSVNKYTAYALLAKIYLNAGVYTGTAQWQKAKEYCDLVIGGPYSLEANRLAPFISENQNSTENIFTIPYDEDNYQGFFLHRRSMHYLSTATFNANTTFWNGFCAQERLVDLFETGDTRKSGLLVGPQFSSTGSALVDPSAGGAPLVLSKEVPALNMTNSFSLVQIRMSGARLAKFEVKKGVKDNMSNDFPLFRLADFILMKAECELRLGNVAAAKGLINQIRVVAGVPAWSDAQITLDNLLAERGREMWCEGHRRQDLIRFGKFNDAWWEKAPDAASNNIFPIPQSAKDTNPNL